MERVSALRGVLPLLLFIRITFGVGLSAAEAPREVFLLPYEGLINPVSSELILTGIRRAGHARAEALIIQLDTPGGLDTSMRETVQGIIGSPVPVVVYIAPGGARAASAGVFITIAAHLAAMAPGTNIGAAHPVLLQGGEMDKEMKTKVENDAAAYIRSLAERRGRNVKWTEEAVRKSVSATEREAKTLGLIDFISPDLPTLLQQIDGRQVITSEGPVTLHTVGAAVKPIPMGFRLKVLRIISDPNVAYVLMLLGIYGLIFELSTPGSVLPGLVGAISLILAFYAFQTLPINYAGLLLILLSLALLLAEVKLQSFGLLGVGGIVAFLLGSLMLFPGEFPMLRVSLGVILPSVLLTAVFFLAIVGAAWKAQRRKPVTGAEALQGQIGIAKSNLDPEGQILVRGEIWEAEGFEAIHAGEKVRVLEIQGLKARVERVRD